MHHQFQFMVVAENRAFKLDPPAKLNKLPPGIYLFVLIVGVCYRDFVLTVYHTTLLLRHWYEIMATM